MCCRLCPNKGLAFGPAFALLADLANLDNHGRLTKPLRSGHTPKIKRVSGIDEPGSRGWRLSMIVEHDGRGLDGLEVAPPGQSIPGRLNQGVRRTLPDSTAGIAELEWPHDVVPR